MKKDNLPEIMTQEQIDYLESLKEENLPSGWWILPTLIVGIILLYCQST